METVTASDHPVSSRRLGEFDGFVPDNGCTCLDAWAYMGQSFYGNSCGNPDKDVKPWCFVKDGCSSGRNWAYCEKPEPVASPTKAPTSPPVNSPTKYPTQTPPTKYPTEAPPSGGASGSLTGSGRHVELMIANDFSQFNDACKASRRVDGNTDCSGEQAKLAAAQARSIQIANEVKEIYKRMNFGITVTLVAHTSF